MNRALALLVAVLAWFCLPSLALAQTVVPAGDIVNQVWTPAGSPYLVQGNITVPSGAFLTIHAGTTVKFKSFGSPSLTVRGTFNVLGTAQNLVNFEAEVGTQIESWYGIVIEPMAVSASITGARVRHTSYGIRSEAPGSVLQVTDSTFQHSLVGIHLLAGTPTLTRIRVSDAFFDGLYVDGSASATVNESIIYRNGDSGIHVHTTGGANTSVTLSRCTIHQNEYGVYARSDAGSSTNVSVHNSNVTANYVGLYRYILTGSASVSVTYSNVWDNNGGTYDYFNVTPGVGNLSANPLYRALPNDFRITSNSPSRFAAGDGGDIGPLPYVGDPTVGLHGTLWSNTTFDLAGSPYIVTGDLTIPPGVTLTIEPGVVVEFQHLDVMRGYDDRGRSELRVFGTLTATGTASQPITMVGENSAGIGVWYGIVLHPGASGSTLDRVVISNARFAVRHQSAGSHTLRRLELSTITNGIYADAGTLSLDQITVRNGANYGIHLTGTAQATITNCLLRNNAKAGVYLHMNGGAASEVTVQNCTINANGNYGVYARAEPGSSLSATLRNAIVTNHSNYGVFRYATDGAASVDVTHSNVWNNAQANYQDVSAGTNSISANPLYVAPPSNLKLQSSSVCIDTGDATGAPSWDLDGVSRPVDGDGMNGAEYDMGAYEYVDLGFCGDGVLQPGEVCDDGGFNGSYGYCNASCSGAGPFCSDGFVQAPEQCDDGNSSNTDACLNTCMHAFCGDGFVRFGIEECDDGNDVAGDGCAPNCTLENSGQGGGGTGGEGGQGQGGEGQGASGQGGGGIGGAGSGGDGGQGQGANGQGGGGIGGGGIGGAGSGGDGGQGQGANGQGGGGIGGAGSGGDGGQGANGLGGSDPGGQGGGVSGGDGELGGCGCRTAGTTPERDGWAFGLFGLVLLAARRRRRAA